MSFQRCTWEAVTLALALFIAPSVTLKVTMSQKPIDMVAEIDALNIDLFPEELQAMLENFKPPPSKEFVRAPEEVSKVPIFFHVHKSMGTWMCHLAHAQTPSLKLAPHNCNRDDDDIYTQLDWNFFDKGNTCQQRIADQKGEGWGFEEIERWVDFNKEGSDVGDFCPQYFSYSIIMREPIKRLHSQMQANSQDYSSVDEWLRENHHPGSYGFQSSYVPYDNFYTRILGGREAYLANSGGITEKHLEAAKRNLDKLDAVMICEDLLSHLPQLERVTGWQDIVERAKVQVHDNHCVSGAVGCSQFDLDPIQMKALMDRNKIDYMLYEYAKKVAHNKTQMLWR